MGDRGDVGELRRERCGDRRVTELDLRNFLVFHLGQLAHDRRGVELNVQRRQSSVLASLFETTGSAHLGGLALLAVSSDGLGSLLLRLDRIREQVGNDRRDGGRRLTEARRDPQLLLVDLLRAFFLLVLEDRLQVLLSTVQEGDANVGLLERADIVRAVAGHERNVAERLERGQDELFLRRRDAGVDPGVLNELVPRGTLVGKLLNGVSSHADVVLVEERRVEGRRWVDRDDDGLVDRAPGKFCRSQTRSVGTPGRSPMSTRQRTSLRGSTLRAVQNQSFTVDNLDILGDRDRREGVVSGNHDTAVRGVGEVLERLDRVRLERAVEDEETGKDEFRLDLVPRDAGRLVLVHAVDPLVAEREDTRATLGEPLVRLFVVGRDRSVHALERLGRALDGDESTDVGRAGLDERDGRHALELRRELEAAADGNRDVVLLASALLSRRNTVTRVELPLERIERGLLHRVSDDTIVEEDERVSRGESERGFQAGLVDRNQLLAVRRAVKVNLHQCHARQQFDASLTRRQQNSLNASNTLDDEVLAGDSASLVEAADVDATRKRNTERLGTEDRCRAGSGVREQQGRSAAAFQLEGLAHAGSA